MSINKRDVKKAIKELAQDLIHEEKYPELIYDWIVDGEYLECPDNPEEGDKLQKYIEEIYPKLVVKIKST